MVENIFRHLAHRCAARDSPIRDGRLADKLHRVLTAAVEVDKPIFFSVIITIAAFLPLFTMQGVEGQIFGPMSRTYAYALLGAVIATFTVTPVMSSILLPAQVQRGRDVPGAADPPGLSGRAAARGAHATGSRRDRGSRSCVVCGVLGARLGTEFLPKLEEGNLWIRALLPPTITLEAGDGDGRAHAQRDQELRAGAHGGLRAGPRRRRHRSGRLVRRRVLRAAEAVRRMAEGPDQGEAGQADERRSSTANSSASISTSRNTSRTISRRRSPA